jgi:hypothetical protein
MKGGIGILVRIFRGVEAESQGSHIGEVAIGDRKTLMRIHVQIFILDDFLNRVGGRVLLARFRRRESFNRLWAEII